MEAKSKRIGVISIIIHNREESAMKVNDTLYRHGESIIGRFGIPYDPKGIHVIALIVNGTIDEITGLTIELASLPDVDANSVLSKE
jgi:putative iron-only hydrogenase system regulator